MARPEDMVPVAIAARSGLDESVHFGAVVGLDRAGDVAVSIGNRATIVYPRSSNKPMQAVAMVRAGLRLAPELLALVCASHDGTPMHVDAARRILDGAGLDDAALGNTPGMPLGEASAREVIRRGEGPTAITMNCSGKHAGMLATCRLNEWPLDGYLDEQHPLQRAITATIDELAGEPHAHIGVDGCGAPAHAMSLLGLARCFRAIATGDDTAASAVVAAMTGHPRMVGGVGREVTVLMEGVPRLFGKDGADAVFAAAMPDGRAVAVKIADGGQRAVNPVLLAALAALGVDVDGVAAAMESSVTGHGRPVGRVRALF